MQLSLIVARSANGVIGRENQLPWHLPNDLKYFREVTMGKPIIMGRKTFESIGKPLPGRKNIVITRQQGYSVPDGVAVVSSLDEAVKVATAEASISGVEEAVIIGGEQIYRAAMDKVTRLYITEVHAELEGDAFFPVFDTEGWNKVGQQDFPACEKNPYDYSFVVFEAVGR